MNRDEILKKFEDANNGKMTFKVGGKDVGIIADVYTHEDYPDELKDGESEIVIDYFDVDFQTAKENLAGRESEFDPDVSLADIVIPAGLEVVHGRIDSPTSTMSVVVKENPLCGESKIHDISDVFVRF